MAKAKKLIAEAGVATPVSVDFMVPNNPESRQAAEVIQAMAQEAGFDMKIRVTEFATSLSEAEQGRFQAFFIGWSGRVDPDGNSYIFLKCKAPQNNGHFCSKDVDQWLDDARQVNTARGTQGDLREGRRQVPEGGIDHLSLPSLGDHCACNKLEGYQQLPDGLVRLVGVSVKP